MLLDVSQLSCYGCSLGKRHTRGRCCGSQVWVSLEIRERQLGALAASVTPAATDGHTSWPKRALESAHAGLRRTRTSTHDFDKVGLEEQWADWCGADDLHAGDLFMLRDHTVKIDVKNH